MAAVIIAWNPEELKWAGTYAADVERVRRTGILRKTWALRTSMSLDIGIDAWLLVRGQHQAMRGLVGHGTLAGVRRSRPVADTAMLLDIDFDLLLPHGEQLGFPQVAARLPGIMAEFQALVIDGAEERAVRELWAEANAPEAGSVAPVPGALPAVSIKRTPVIIFEQDPDLRSVVLAHRGGACHACDLDFELAYGLSGSNLIQVHLITPLAHIDEEYEPDPLVDLVPLCPTCHVVAHSRWPEPYSVEEIRTMRRHSGFLRGTLVSEEQLKAEAAAARILGS